MNNYLDIAQSVLRASKRPMTAKGILDAAYKAEIVPMHLHGKTQHKTLQARLSEEILYHRSSSLFFRTKPGYFFLSEFLSDPSIPVKFKERFPARRRTRDLLKDPQLVIDASFLSKIETLHDLKWNTFIKSATSCDAARYVPPKEKDDSTVAVWTFSLVRKQSAVLTYRMGRYRDDRDCFANRKSIGFPGVLSVPDRTLFSEEDYGASENALGVLLADLDLSFHAFEEDGIEKPIQSFLRWVNTDDESSALLVIMEWSCPDWFEPTTKKLSLNDPHWTDMSIQPNHLEDFEPWSVATMQAILKNEMDQNCELT